MAFSPLGDSPHVVVSVSIDFLSDSLYDAPFHHKAHDHRCADWNGDHLRDVPWEDIFKLSPSAAAASEFCEWVEVAIDVYIPHCKHQVKSHSSSWISAACAAAMIHRNHFFHLYLQSKSTEYTGNFRKHCSRCERVLEAGKLAYANKEKSPSFPRNLALGNFCKLQLVFSTKIYLLHLIYSIARWGCLLHLIKQNCFLKTFLRTLTLKTQYLFTCFPSKN